MIPRPFVATSILASLLGALAAPPPVSAASWRALPVVAGDGDRAVVQDVAVSPFDPNRLLAWTDGLLYRSTDAGQQWAPVPAQFQHEGAAPELRGLRFGPLDRAWVAIGPRLLRSSDFGGTWERWGGPAPGERIAGFELDSGDPAAAWVAFPEGAERGVWRTEDHGESWAFQGDGLPGAGASTIAQRPGDPETLLLGTTEGLARTTDGGSTWSGVRPGPPVGMVKWGVDGDLVRALQDGLVGSTDAGLTWREIPSEIRRGWRPFTFDPLDPSLLLLARVDFCIAGNMYGNYGSIRRSTNDGDTWTSLDLTSCLTFGGIPGSSRGTGIEFAGGTGWSWNPWTVAGTQAFQRTTDDGVSWESATAGMQELPLQTFDVDGAGTLYAREWYGQRRADKLRRSTDRGASWELVQEWIAGALFDESFVFQASRTRPGDLMQAGYADDGDWGWTYAARSMNGGSDWLSIENATPGNPILGGFNHGSGHKIYVWTGLYPLHGQTIPQDVRLYRSDDGGWVYQEVGEPPFAPVATLITPENDSEVFVVTFDSDPVVRSTDAGLTWHARSNGLPAEPPAALLMDPMNGDHLVCVFGRGIPWESTDRGVTWRRLAVGLDPARDDPTEIPAPPDLELRRVTIGDADWDVHQGQRRVFLATDRGIWASDLGFVGTETPQIEFDWVRYSRATGLLTAASRRHGVFALDLAPFGPLEPPTGGPFVGAAPTFAPLSLAPNPFAGSASIRFGLGRAGSARLDVFDPAGRRVATLVDGRLAAGRHSFTWSGRNEAGRSVAPGVYFVRLVTPEQQMTRRIVRLR